MLFDIVKTYGDQFEAHWWKDLFQASFTAHSQASAVDILNTQVLFRIFDNMKLKENGDDSDFPDRSQPSLTPVCSWTFHLTFLTRLAIKSEWLNTTCNHALYALTDVFSQVVQLKLIRNIDHEFSCISISKLLPSKRDE